MNGIFTGLYKVFKISGHPLRSHLSNFFTIHCKGEVLIIVILSSLTRLNLSVSCGS